MNMQNLMRQAQSLQSDMLKVKAEIDSKEFEYKNSMIIIKANGKKEILSIDIEKSNFSDDDLEIIEDLLTSSINNLFKQIDEFTEQKMSKFSNIAGLF